MHISATNSTYSQEMAYAEQQVNTQIQSDADSEEKNNQEIQQLLGLNQPS